MNRDQMISQIGGTTTNPPLTHMVAVTLQDPLRMTYSTKQRKVAGTFHVDPGAAAEGHTVVYKLDAEYLQ